MRFIHDQQANFFIRPNSGGYSINGTFGVDFYVSTASSTVDCHATSIINWECITVGSAASSATAFTPVTISSSTTLTHGQTGSTLYADVSSGAMTVTLPSCSTATGTVFHFAIINNQNALTFATTGSDQVVLIQDTGEQSSSQGGTLSLTPGTAFTTSATGNQGIITGKLVCAGTNLWAGDSHGSITFATT